MQQIAVWLKSLGLGQYAERFAENCIDASVLQDLTDQDLEKKGSQIRTLVGNVTLDVTGGGAQSGVLTEYRQTKGYVLVERPSNIKPGTSDIGDTKELLQIVDYFRQNNLIIEKKN